MDEGESERIGLFGVLEGYRVKRKTRRGVSEMLNTSTKQTAENSN